MGERVLRRGSEDKVGKEKKIMRRIEKGLIEVGRMEGYLGGLLIRGNIGIENKEKVIGNLRKKGNNCLRERIGGGREIKILRIKLRKVLLERGKSMDKIMNGG